jgi:hypothetical protein
MTDNKQVVKTKVNVFCEVIADGEVYGGYMEKALQTIMVQRKLTYEQAERLLLDATPTNPVELSKERMWVEFEEVLS